MCQWGIVVSYLVSATFQLWFSRSPGERSCVKLFAIYLKSLNVPSDQLNSKNNCSFLLFKTIFRHWNCFLSSVARDGKDGNGLKLDQVGSSFNVMTAEITKKNTMVFAVMKFVSYLQNSTGAFCVLVKAASADLSQNWPRTVVSSWHSTFNAVDSATSVLYVLHILMFLFRFLNMTLKSQ